MAKNKTTETALRDRSTVSGKLKKPPKERREILFPTEPTSIPREEIDRAIEAVISRRK
jgi:hypothetical protein